MKKLFYSIIATLGLFSFTSCGDMLEVDNDSMVTNPSLSTKTDSVFYALGIAQAMQQLADQYFFIGEMRGDLVTTTGSTNTNLRQLADYSANAANAYDSAYVYYKVINNCNYYLANRNTNLYTGSTNVSEVEYAAVEAWRAWAYLQLARTYGGNEVGVPFFTEPLTAISQIQEDRFPKYTLSQIVDALAPRLEKYSTFAVPTFGVDHVGIGTPNWGGGTKNMYTRKIFVPVDVILGEMYLEKGDYMKAAQHYALYLCEQGLTVNLSADMRKPVLTASEMPDDMATQYNYLVSTYQGFFGANPNAEVVSYIPMAVNSQRGQTSNIPNAFGYDYYSIEKSGSCPRLDDIQIAPSQTYYDLTSTCDYYYFKLLPGSTSEVDIASMPWGDGRASYQKGNGNSATLNMDANDTTKVYISKNMNANVVLYRVSTIYLHLAEALNRAGYSDIAFAILRNGISDYLKEIIAEPEVLVDADGNEIVQPIPAHKYMSRRSVELLQGPLYFLSEKYMSYFDKDNAYGVHSHGGGFLYKGTVMNSVGVNGSLATSVGSTLNTMYLPKPVVQAKIDELNAQYGVGADIDNEQHFITAMELVLCDEYAKELAFEGIRFYDLQRMARHLNESGVFGGNFGSRWFASKLAGNNPVKSLENPKNWYLPFK